MELDAFILCFSRDLVCAFTQALQMAQNALSQGDKRVLHLILQYYRSEKRDYAKAKEILGETKQSVDAADGFVLYQRMRLGEPVQDELLSSALAEIRAKAEAGDPVSGFYYA